MRISLQFSCKYRLKFAPNYVFTERPKFMVNIKTGRVISQVSKGGSIGYIVDGKFYTLTRLRECLEVIRDEEIPF